MFQEDSWTNGKGLTRPFELETWIDDIFFIPPLNYGTESSVFVSDCLSYRKINTENDNIRLLSDFLPICAFRVALLRLRY